MYQLEHAAARALFREVDFLGRVGGRQGFVEPPEVHDAAQGGPTDRARQHAIDIFPAERVRREDVSGRMRELRGAPDDRALSAPAADDAGKGVAGTAGIRQDQPPARVGVRRGRDGRVVASRDDHRRAGVVPLDDVPGDGGLAEAARFQQRPPGLCVGEGRGRSDVRVGEVPPAVRHAEREIQEPCARGGLTDN